MAGIRIVIGRHGRYDPTLDKQGRLKGHKVRRQLVDALIKTLRVNVLKTDGIYEKQDHEVGYVDIEFDKRSEVEIVQAITSICKIWINNHEVQNVEIKRKGKGGRLTLIESIP